MIPPSFPLEPWLSPYLLGAVLASLFPLPFPWRFWEQRVKEEEEEEGSSQMLGHVPAGVLP